MKDYSHISESDYAVVAGPDWPSFEQFQSLQNIPEFVFAEIDSMLRPVQGFSHPSFCVLPFYAMEYPEQTPCCLLSSSASLPDIKSQMLQGKRPSACIKCWNLEDQGIESDRQLKNKTLDFYSNKDLEFLIQDCDAGRNRTVSYKIDTSNTCNAACATCGGKSSSTWNRLEKKNNFGRFQNWKISPEQTQNWVDYNFAKTIIFRGGEPLLSDTNFYILEQLIDHGNFDCYISFVTNGSFSLNSRQKEILSNFKKLNFCFSIDGIGHAFEYIRWPLKWPTIEENISWCRSQNIDISVSYTLSNLNLMYHDQNISWFESNQIPYLINPVYSPSYFRPNALPAALKQWLGNHCNNNIGQWLSHSAADDVDLEKFKHEIHKQDSWKNIYIGNYLPELTKWIDL